MKSNIDALAELVDLYHAHFPDVVYRTKRSSRAREAAKLVEGGHITPAGPDTWQVGKVGGHLASLHADTCTCADHYKRLAPMTNYGRLCKHRIAVQMYHSPRYQATLERNDLTSALRQYAENNPGKRVIMLLEDPDDQRYRRLVGIVAHMNDLRRFPPDQAITFTRDQLVESLKALRWSTGAMPRKQRGYLYAWELRTDPGGGRVMDSFWHLRGVTEFMEERARSERFTKQARADYDRNLSETAQAAQQ